MLLVYLEPFDRDQNRLLLSWQSQVRYWPRSYAHTDIYSAAIPLDWWLLFSNPLLASQWLLQFPEHSRIIRTLFDDEDDDNMRRLLG